MTSTNPSASLHATAPDGVGEIEPGTDLAEVLLAALEAGGQELEDGSIVAVTSKVVSKSEGRVVSGDREAHIDAETDRVVATRGGLRITRTHHGLTLAAAGIDNSNVSADASVLLPSDPDASARRFRTRVRELSGANVAVLVTDTAGRPWRDGQTDIAIGAAGLRVLVDHAGLTDAYGNELAVTAPAIADEIAGLCDLVAPKLANRPFVVVHGLSELVLAAHDDGQGASALIRPEEHDLFGLGARDAVIAALGASASGSAARGFGARAEPAQVRAALDELGLQAEDLLASVLAVAMGWTRKELIMLDEPR